MDGFEEGIPFMNEDPGPVTTKPRRAGVSIFGSRLLIARFSVPEGYQSSVIDDAISELRAVGAAVYTVELAGAGVPLLDIGEVTYVGESNIQEAVASFTNEGNVMPTPKDE